MNAKTFPEAEKPTFETALSRLERILELMNSGEVALSEAVALYEEADKLMAFCSCQLADAEQKIEQLQRHRDGSLALNSDGTPQTKPFPPTACSV